MYAIVLITIERTTIGQDLQSRAYFNEIIYFVFWSVSKGMAIGTSNMNECVKSI